MRSSHAVWRSGCRGWGRRRCIRSIYPWGIGPRSWRRPPQQPVSQVEEPECLRRWELWGSVCYSAWPKVADAVIKAHKTSYWEKASSGCATMVSKSDGRGGQSPTGPQHVMHAFPSMRRALGCVQGIAVQRAHMRCSSTTHAERLRSAVWLSQDVCRGNTVGEPSPWCHHHDAAVRPGRGR
jgi:hypothetical protein